MKKGSADSLQIWRSYSEGYNKKRIILEAILPISLALISMVITYLSFETFTKSIKGIEEINKDFFSIIAIQIGFNITSLALISSFNKDTLKNVFSTLKDFNQKEQALKKLLASFIYCVFLQSSIIIFGLFFNLNATELTDITFLSNLPGLGKGILFYLFYFSWLSIIFHSFMVSVRNVVLIYKFILVILKS